MPACTASRNSQRPSWTRSPEIAPGHADASPVWSAAQYGIGNAEVSRYCALGDHAQREAIVHLDDGVDDGAVFVVAGDCRNNGLVILIRLTFNCRSFIRLY